MDQEDMVRVDASVRSRCGTGSARALRHSGLVPATIYGKGRDPVSISLSRGDFLKKCRTLPIFSKIIELSIDDKKEYALTKAVQRHPVNGEIMHVDFQFVDRSAEIKIEVPLEFLNEQKCAGVKRGGVLNVLQRSLVVQCSPHAIPKSLEIDLLDLEIGHSLHVSNMKLPKGIKVVMKEEDPVIVAVSAVEEFVEQEEQGEGQASSEGQ